MYGVHRVLWYVWYALYVVVCVLWCLVCVLRVVLCMCHVTLCCMVCVSLGVCRCVFVVYCVVVSDMCMLCHSVDMR